MGFRNLFMCLVGPFSCGEKAKHISKIARKSQDTRKIVFMYFAVRCFFVPPKFVRAAPSENFTKCFMPVLMMISGNSLVLSKNDYQY